MGELNSPEELALRTRTSAEVLATLGWTLDEWKAETARRRIESREAMHARIKVLQAQEESKP